MVCWYISIFYISTFLYSYVPNSYHVLLMWLGYPLSYGSTGFISSASCTLILTWYKSLLSTYTILFIRSVTVLLLFLLLFFLLLLFSLFILLPSLLLSSLLVNFSVTRPPPLYKWAFISSSTVLSVIFITLNLLAKVYYKI